MKKEKRYYVAYGSNLNIEQMAYRCPGAKIIGTSEIPNYRLLFKGSGTGAYLTIEPSEGRKVPVAVWEVTKWDECALDRYEGYPRFYYKKEIELPVKPDQGGRTTRRKVFVYIMDETRRCGIPSRYYIETCLDGYKDFGFDTDFLFEALGDTMDAMESE